jgi:bifunctional ADP-heptose synthase (sugar kinase/adenylyltransferase)
VEELAQQIGDRTVVVLGDVMLDEFIWGDVTRISPEAPVPWSRFAANQLIWGARRTCWQIWSRWGPGRA